MNYGYAGRHSVRYVEGGYSAARLRSGRGPDWGHEPPPAPWWHHHHHHHPQRGSGYSPPAPPRFGGHLQRTRRHSGGPQHHQPTTFWRSSSGSSSGFTGDEQGSSEESELRSSSEQGDLTPDSSADPVSQVIPRIIKPRKRRKKEKKPKIPRMSGGGGGGGEEPSESGSWQVDRRRSPGYDTQSSSSSSCCSSGDRRLEPVYRPGWYLDALCADLRDQLRMTRHLTPPGDLLLTPPPSPGAELTRRPRHSNSCPASLEIPAECPVNATQPPQRPWIVLGRPSSTRPTSIFTVMCYNVLCEKYATRQMYGYCPNWALDWEYRKKSIMQEIRNYSADIITLQEVQTDQFYSFFLPQLQRDKYEGIFSPKSRAKTMAESERKYVDGCAIFWRTEKFSLVKEYLIEFNQLAMANAEGSDDMLNRVMTKDNIGLAAMLETREAAWENGAPSDPAQLHQRLLVCTAHVHWDPEFCDVKLIQTMMLIHEIRQIMEKASREAPSFRPRSGAAANSSNIQLLLCGDLNSLPDSGVVEFLVNGRVPANHPDFKELGYRTSLKKLSSSDRPNEYAHPFRIASSYSPDIMPYTNYTYDFKGIIDYIFYCRDTMTPLGILGPLDPNWLRDNKVQGCPHPHIPSDHFSLLVELEMTPAPTSGGLSGPVNGLIGHR